MEFIWLVHRILKLIMSDESSGKTQDWVDNLEQSLQTAFPSIRRAREKTGAHRSQLLRTFSGTISADTSLVVFGSIAREEVTSGSDSDWILLIDGQSSPEHLNQEHTIADELARSGIPKPGRSGIFGRMIGSHDIVHEIGGEDDTNSNTTRRVLLLLESWPIGSREAYDRVRRQI
jgi:predicted nucleotidyltransferase